MFNKVFHCLMILISGFFLNCNQNSSSLKEGEEKVSFSYDHIKDSLAINTLKKASEASGGLDRWYAKKSIRFSKSYQLLFEDGTVEQEANQHHHYISQPTENVTITWEKDQDMHTIVFADGNPQKYVNDILDTTANKQSLLNNVLSSTFVANLPFKIITDEGADISYTGKDTLENGQTVECIQVKYYPDKFSSHSSEDVWNLYFDEEHYYLIAYMVQHADHISYVRNTKDTIIDGFYFVLDRESYRVTEDRAPLYLRAVYHYGDYKIVF